MVFRPSHIVCPNPPVCFEANYMKYVRDNLQNSIGWKKDILNSIIDLYKDLEQNLEPRYLMVNSKNLSVHPISFAIPYEYVMSSIPAKEKYFGRVIPDQARSCSKSSKK